MNNPPIILQTTETEFRSAIHQEFTEGSAISPALFQTIAEFASDLDIQNGEVVGEPIAEFLNWNIKESQNGFSSRPTAFALLLRNEDGEPFQVKLNYQSWNPEKSRYGKAYKAPKLSDGEFSPAYLPPIDMATRQKIEARYRVKFPSDGAVWDFVALHPEISIVITEGAKKSLCALSHGVIAIALYGCDAGSKKIDGEHVLIPALARFCQPGRIFILAFDKDENPETVRRVNRAIRRLSWLLGAKSKGVTIKTATWEASQGKGLDDLVVNCGPEILLTAIAKSKNNQTSKSDDDRPAKRAIADQLIDIGRAENISYFVTPDDRVYADVITDCIRLTMVLRGKQFKQYLRSMQFKNTEKSPGSDAVQQAIDTLEALAVTNADKRDVHVRLAEHDEKIYIDIADESWKSIEVDRHGWRVVDDSPVRFIRGASSSLPMPIEGGRVEDFKDLCGFSDDAWVLILTFLLQALKPEKAYPILFFIAPPTTGKTTITRAFKNLVDPSPGQPRKTVGEVRDFAIHATKRHVLPIDNLSGVTNDQSDVLCCASTGGGHSQRTLHSDDEETVMNFTNLLVLNGIGEIASRGDLLSRAYPVTLTAPTKRLSEAVFEAKFEALRPSVLGALLTLLSQVLAVLPDIQGTYTGDGERFVSFVELGLALERVLNWTPGKFLRVIGATREEAHDTAIESSPIGVPLRDFMSLNETWSGTATNLLQQLKLQVDESVARSKFFPQNSVGLGKMLTRLHSDLAATGIEVTYRKTNGTKIVQIVKRPTKPQFDDFVASVEVISIPDSSNEVFEEAYEYTYEDEPPAHLNLGDWDSSDDLMAVGDDE